MKKKFMCLALLAGMLLSSMTGCSLGASASDGEDEDLDTSAASANTATITLTAITGDSTTDDAIKQVQEAMNKLTKSQYKTQVILQLVTEDEYVSYIENSVATIEAQIAAEEEAAAAAKAAKKAQKEAEKLAQANTKTKRSRWTTTTKAETEEDTAVTQEMTEDEYGREVVKYPDLEGTHLDIIFMTGIDMYNDFVEKGYLQSLDEELTSSAKLLNKYLTPAVLTAGSTEGSTYAIINNRIMGEYTYLLIDKDLADKYALDVERVTTLSDCEAFLDAVKENEPDYVPMNKSVDLNYVQYATGERSVLGAVIRSTYTTSTKAVPKDLLQNGEYINHYQLLDKMEEGGYFGTGDKYAIEVVNGYVNTPEKENWEEDYYVITYEKPICSNETVYSGMFGVSAYASDVERCMEIVTMLNTNGELRDIYAFGIEGVNYEKNEDGTIHMLNDDWSMDFYHCGNTFIGSVPETLPSDYAEVGKMQNTETITGPYFRWIYESEKTSSLLKAYNTASEKYLAMFDAAEDKLAFSNEYKETVQSDAAIEPMLNADNSDGLLGAYVEFQASTYGNE